MSEAVMTRTVSPNKAKKSILRAFKKKRPLFLWGPPGIGKSDIVGQVTTSLLNSYHYGILQTLKECHITRQLIIQ